MHRKNLCTITVTKAQTYLMKIQMADPKVLVLGGTGPAGICLLRELVHRNCATFVYARNPSKIPDDIRDNKIIEVWQNE
jgi:hypothetical protein